MDVEADLANLERRHDALEKELSQELAHPAADPLRIAEIKRHKLKVKDQIAELAEQTLH